MKNLGLRDLARDVCLLDISLSRSDLERPPHYLPLRSDLPLLGDRYLMLGFPRSVPEPG